MKKNWTGYLLIAPAFLLLGAVIVYPVGRALWMSVHKIVLTNPGGGTPFIGLENYVEIVQKPYFWNSVENTVVWTLSNLVAQIILGTGVAILLNQKFPMRALARGVVLIPWITPSVVAALTWRWMYDAEFGIINAVLLRLDLIERTIAWLGNTNTAMWAVIIESIWKGTPFVTVMILAVLQAVPSELYDAAKVDGANGIKRFRYVTLPLIMPTIIIAATLTTIYTFNNFNAIWLLTGGGPLRATETLTILVYREAFQQFNLGTSTAAGMIVFFILFVAVVLFGRYYIKAQTEVQ
ncbi:MAG TPA: sugar ABC transporter permease [Candidatus Sulfomarinibacteraceae bacterium]|nr:sugar ABC transporter permease [Candidatus Sulfomarinibacteraceae bacterium]